MRAREPEAASTARRPQTLAWIAFALLAACYLALPLGRYFSDSHLCVTRVSVGPTPYYNVAYVPCGWLVQRLFGAPLGWSVERTLVALSAVALAAAVVLTVRLIERAGVRARWAWTWGALMALAPGVLLHVGVVEVHALQAFGAVVALHVALCARDSTQKRAWALLAAAGSFALALHLTHVLLLPGLVLVATTGERGRGVRVGWRSVGAVLAALAVLLGVVLALTQQRVLEGVDRGAWEWAFMLRWFGTKLVEAWVEQGGRTPVEALAYLADELAAPAGVLLVAPLLLVATWRWLGPSARRTALVFALLPVPAALLFSQGGIWERGGYFLSYFPALALVGALSCEALAARARAPGIAFAALVVPLVAVQALLAPSQRRALVELGPEPREWAARVAQVLAPGDKVLVASLAKSLALEALRPDVLAPDVARLLDMVPERARRDELKKQAPPWLVHDTHRGAVYLDAALWEGRSADAIEALAREPLAELTPMAGLPEGYGLLRLDVADAP